MPILAVLIAGAASVHAASTATYVGAVKCAECHASEYQVWTQGRHSKMVQPATPLSVKGTSVELV